MWNIFNNDFWRCELWTSDTYAPGSVLEKNNPFFFSLNNLIGKLGTEIICWAKKKKDPQNICAQSAKIPSTASDRRRYYITVFPADIFLSVLDT